MVTYKKDGTAVWTPDTVVGKLVLYTLMTVAWTLMSVALALPFLVVSGALYGIGRLLHLW